MCTSTNRYGTLLVVAVAYVILLAACENGPVEPGEPNQPAALELAVVAGDSQVAPGGALLPALLTVRVTNRRNEPVPNVTIKWAALEIGGEVTARSVTDAAGIASAARKLGPNAGVRVTTAVMHGRFEAGVRFTSIGHVQGAMEMLLNPGDHGDGQVDSVLATLAPYKVLLRDYRGAPVKGVRVTWTILTGGGFLSGASAASSISDANGVAQITHTLASTANPIVLVRAMVPGLIGSPDTFSAVAKPGNPVSLVHVSAANAPALVSSSHGYTVGVADAHGNAADGVIIDWAVTMGDGVVAPAQTVAIQDMWDNRVALATATHTFGPDEGTHVVTATVRDAPDPLHVTFTTRTVTAIVSVRAADYYSCFYYGWCDGKFDPSDVTVPVGKTVGWRWDAGACDLVFEDDPTQPTSAPWQSFKSAHYRTFETPGAIRYRCTGYSTDFTQGMVGTVGVQ